MATKKNWIQGAIQTPGAFSKKSKKAGVSTNALAKKILKKGSKATAKIKKQAVLANTLAGLRKKKK